MNSSSIAKSCSRLVSGEEEFLRENRLGERLAAAEEPYMADHCYMVLTYQRLTGVAEVLVMVGMLFEDCSSSGEKNNCRSWID